MRKLHEWLAGRYQFIFIDSPPIGIVTDSMLLARHADVVVYVVRHNVTRKTHAEYIHHLYHENKLKNLCVVMNAVPTGRPGASYGYGHWYGYGYGYGYYDEDRRPGNVARRLAGLFRNRS
jgi:Mrp family chromosome partitioning ATPase